MANIVATTCHTHNEIHALECRLYRSKHDGGLNKTSQLPKIMTLVKLNQKPAYGRFFDDTFARDFFNAPAAFNRLNTSTPQVNVHESDTAFTLEVVAPGIDRTDLKVNVEGKRLIISYEHSTESTTESAAKTLRREFALTSFSRSFTLPNSVNPEAVEATFANGVLTLTLPKHEEAKPQARQIEVR